MYISIYVYQHDPMSTPKVCLERQLRAPRVPLECLRCRMSTTEHHLDTPLGTPRYPLEYPLEYPLSALKYPPSTLDIRKYQQSAKTYP
jgi:hypothetical protein